jgi:acyl-CoA thioesterase I
MVLGDSTAQGLGAHSPDGGYVGQVLAELRRQTGLPWRVLNLSVSGSLTRDVLGAQLPVMPTHADLVTCGIGINDILYTNPAKLFADLRTLIAASRTRPCCSTCRCPRAAGASSAGPACPT